MIDVQVVMTRAATWAEFSGYYWSLDWPLNPTLTAGIAAVAGMVSALWGARLLRAVYILGFMAGGAAAGVHFARQWEVDLLIGLVLGAGVAGLLGYLLYRWWVGLTAALVAALAVAVMGGPWLADQAEAFADTLVEQATGQRFFAVEPVSKDATVAAVQTAPARDVSRVSLASAAGQHEGRPTPAGFVIELGRLIWAEHQADAKRLAVLAGIAAALGLTLGVLLPNFTTILGTSVVGVMVLTISGYNLLSWYLPTASDAMMANPAWLLGGVALILLVSLAFQARRGRMREVAAALPAAAAS